ncbi:hypothetical protein B0I33_102666 [Prauserella shujinwangii]|uniref:Uncharacterized protein n=1 Tax=Prauserella shujinwangii TaxID=1453103 RepID=A0A2T0M1Q8_9PSEU|nr:hypothetical protein [Prauserella shujinwangii]PRX50542.1 hypothetical protein B0I33_102666 [Prauserella shujinwangii]
MSLFSAEASRPRVADLAGLLCGPGQVTSFGRTAARLSAVVDDDWRAGALARECVRHGAEAQVTRLETEESQDGARPLVRTAFRVDLLPLARAWSGGERKVLPEGFTLGGAMLRLWALSGGQPTERGYLLPLDPAAPDTHEPLMAALGMVGLAASTVRPRGGTPAIRITGRRRLATFAELIGPPPPGAEPAWPRVTPVPRAC